MKPTTPPSLPTPAEPTAPTKPLLHRLLAPLASLRVTVVLLSLAMFLVLAGTVAQVDMGTFQAQKKYFHSHFVVIDGKVFLPRNPEVVPRWLEGTYNLARKVKIPFPGGYVLGAALLVNLLAAHTIRFKFSWQDLLLLPPLALMFVLLWRWQSLAQTWLLYAAGVVGVGLVAGLTLIHQKRAGIILIHLGLILLLVGEGISSATQVEGNMVIAKGESSNFTTDSRHIELAVIDPSHPDHDRQILIPGSRLDKANVRAEHRRITDARLPFDVVVEDLLHNSTLLGPRDPAANPKATAGNGIAYTPVRKDPASGARGDEQDRPSAYITLKQGDKDLGRYLVSTVGLAEGFPQVADPQAVVVDGKTYLVQLRFKRDYKPYTIHLKEFSHKRYVGTEIPKDFSSYIRLVDESRGVDRPARIWMNNPMRYRGETFYQSSFIGENITILQVVSNPGLVMPYTACAIGGLGLVIHFCISLANFLSRRFATPAMPKLPPKPGRQTLTIAPEYPITSVLLPALTVLLGIALVIGFAGKEFRGGDAYNLDRAGTIPILYQGREQPLESLARTDLKLISNRERPEIDGKPLHPMQFAMDLLAGNERAQNHQIIRIDHPPLIDSLGLRDAKNPARKHFSFDEILSRDQIREQYAKLDNNGDQMIDSKDEKNWDLYQHELYKLSQKLVPYQKYTMHRGELHLAAPLKSDEGWITLGTASRSRMTGVTPPESLSKLDAVLRSYREQAPEKFNRAVDDYLAALDQSPVKMNHVRFEWLFNRLSPFFHATVLYVLAFLLAAASWAGFSRPLRLSALSLASLALLLQLFGTLGRIYITGRAPVTNLASSAIFIGLVLTFVALLLELVFRNGFSTAVATVGGFLCNMIYLNLASGKDTMAVLQAVLDTNFWLWTHVTAIAIGYSATFLAGLFAILYIFLGMATPALRYPEVGKTLVRIIYGTTCFAVVFSFIGTVLGGIWADQSWGRFWGWDPKENGAVLIVIANALLLHARWGGLVKDRGIVNLALFGNIITAWSWFGTNMLGVGLHSYGFMDAALIGMTAWVGVNLLLMGLTLLPKSCWWSFNAPPVSPGIPVVPVR